MNNIVGEVMFSLEASIKQMKEMVVSAESFKSVLSTIKNVSNKLNDDILSLAKIKDHEFKSIKKNITKLESIINQIELLIYLAKGIVEENIEIEFTDLQMEVYKKFKRIVEREKREVDKFNLQDLKNELKESEKILKMLKTRQGCDYDRNLLKTMYNGFSLTPEEESEMNNYINTINNKNTKLF